MSDVITTYIEFLCTIFPGYFVVMAMHIVWSFLATTFLAVWNTLFDEPRPTADKIHQYVWRAMLLGLLPAAYTARLVEVNDPAITSYLIIAMLVFLRNMIKRPTKVSPGG